MPVNKGFLLKINVKTKEIFPEICLKKFLRDIIQLNLSTQLF